jgi:probable F420-dependent oxidoreductase
VAKQAAAVDVLTGGRLRLGIGTGWNDVEYEVLNMNFHDRGKRSEEQISLLRALWTNEVVDFEGKHHKVTAAGINPLPIQRPIPIWFGGGADPVLRRAARIGDGFFTIGGPTDRSAQLVQDLKRYVTEAGRNPTDFGIEAGSATTKDNPELAIETAKSWEKLGATHHTLNTMNAGYANPDEHINAIAEFKKAMS